MWYLTEAGIEFRVDEYLQIYNIIPNTPLLCAHQDQVGDTPIDKVVYIKDRKKGLIISGNGNIGADDKNGIFILLKLLTEFPNISFIFSTGEEARGDIESLLIQHSEELEDIKYGILFDRRNGSDIIGVMNNYCTQEMDDDLSLLGKKFGYESATGIFSDADALSDYISCVNLSCG